MDNIFIGSPLQGTMYPQVSQLDILCAKMGCLWIFILLAVPVLSMCRLVHVQAVKIAETRKGWIYMVLCLIGAHFIWRAMDPMVSWAFKNCVMCYV